MFLCYCEQQTLFLYFRAFSPFLDILQGFNRFNIASGNISDPWNFRKKMPCFGSVARFERMIYGYLRPLCLINKTMWEAENDRVCTTFDVLQSPMTEIEQLFFQQSHVCGESPEKLVYSIIVFRHSEITTRTSSQKCACKKLFPLIEQDFDEIFILDFYDIDVVLSVSERSTHPVDCMSYVGTPSKAYSVSLSIQASVIF